MVADHFSRPLRARYCGHYSQPRKLQRKEAMIHSPAAHKYRLLIVLTLILTVGVIVPQRSLSRAGEQQSVIHQLRIYQIFDSNKKAFHDRFRDRAMRIMAKYDFKIVATWESKKDNRTEFIYLLEWPDRETHDRSLGEIPARSGMD
jgi:hypothetical protein